MTMRERIAEGRLFTDYCEGLPLDRLKAKKLMKRLNESDPENMWERKSLIKSIFSGNCEAYIEPPFYFCYGYNISLGEGTYINFNCNFIDDGKIIVGDKVMFGAGVTVATVGHPINPDMREYMYTAAVTIRKQLLDRSKRYSMSGRYYRGKYCYRGRKRRYKGYSCKRYCRGKSMQSDTRDRQCG